MERSTKYSLVAWVVLVGLTAFGIHTFKSTPKVRVNPGHDTPASRSGSQLRSIHQAMAVYAASNNDQYPPVDDTFDILYAHGLVETETLVSPLEDGDGISYILTGLQEITFRSDLIAAYEDPKHSEHGVLVVFDDNRTEFLPHAEFEAMLARQRAEQAVP
ncbi:MAG: hypothetical protein D6692_09250 [Planctomycetota bacterium]|nr:MAG: hypothetical protein D6692_09250 [Planctomycetota bacterium]